MNSTKSNKQIFKEGSTTYYWSSKFFPKHIREDVFKLYSFVRVVDDYVDSKPQQTDSFHKIKKLWDESINRLPKADDSIDSKVVLNMLEVSKKYRFDRSWVDSFLLSMEMDINKRKYRNIDDVLEYVYGSAEVIGLMMSKIMGLPKEAQTAAKLQGRAMQWINFLRDINEDMELGRCYIPSEDLKKFGFNKFDRATINKMPKEFEQLLRYEIKRYELWQTQVYRGYKYIPKRLRVPLKTATDMYNWTAKQIDEKPNIVLKKRVKPTKKRVIAKAGANIIYA